MRIVFWMLILCAVMALARSPHAVSPHADALNEAMNKGFAAMQAADERDIERHRDMMKALGATK